MWQKWQMMVPNHYAASHRVWEIKVNSKNPKIRNMSRTNESYQRQNLLRDLERIFRYYD